MLRKHHLPLALATFKKVQMWLKPLINKFEIRWLKPTASDADQSSQKQVRIQTD